jgi:hypothetical protein
MHGQAAALAVLLFADFRAFTRKTLAAVGQAVKLF